MTINTIMNYSINFYVKLFSPVLIFEYFSLAPYVNNLYVGNIDNTGY